MYKNERGHLSQLSDHMLFQVPKYFRERKNTQALNFSNIYNFKNTSIFLQTICLSEDIVLL